MSKRYEVTIGNVESYTLIGSTDDVVEAKAVYETWCGYLDLGYGDNNGLPIGYVLLKSSNGMSMVYRDNDSLEFDGVL